MKKKLTKIQKAARGRPKFDTNCAWFPVPRDIDNELREKIVRLLHQEFCFCCHAKLDLENSRLIKVRASGNRKFGIEALVCEDCVDNRRCKRKACKSCPPGKSALAIFRYQKWKENPYCYYFQQKMPLCNTTVDHVVPRANGGGDIRTNLVLCCTGCNTEKREMSEEEFMEKLTTYLREN